MYSENWNVENFKTQFREELADLFDTTVEKATDYELYYTAASVCRKKVRARWKETDDHCDGYQMKKVYYFTSEILPGRPVGNNLLNVCAGDGMKEAMDELGIDQNLLEDQDVDLPLGNGGLGRLAACLLESSTTLGYPACGYSIKYKNGLFKQKIQNNEQIELPDSWETEKYPYPLIAEKTKSTQYVTFGKAHEADYQVVEAVPYDVPIVGSPIAGSDCVIVNRLRLWDAPNDPQITECLYPNDDTAEGKKLRMKQEYFFVSASLQVIVKEFKEQYGNFAMFPDKVCLHINDTHPAVIIPELMRILVDEENLSWDKAWTITTSSCSYTNHTIMAEALEKWSIELYKPLLPRIYEIIEEIHRRFEAQIREKYCNNEAKVKDMAILYDGEIRMANLAIVGSFSVNGVAALHTKLLKEDLFKSFYEMMPVKFNNKTNGVTHRRFLIKANPALSGLISRSLKSPAWMSDMKKVKGLEAFAEDRAVQKELEAIKLANKKKLAKYIKEHNHIEVDPNAIFDVHVKRIHEYKRQLMNALRIRCLYSELKNDSKFFENFYPMVFIFAGKAHPSYKAAKKIITFIHELADEINHDTSIAGKMKVVFLENYNVSLAELIIPASDVSEQISTAGKEASGTGNMKFMMNGALTIGTLDGANVEIRDAVGEENMFLFGMNADEVMEHKRKRDYIASWIPLENPKIKKAVDSIRDAELRNSLLYAQSPTEDADPYFVLKDLESYIGATLKLNELYKNNRETWNKMAILNVANSGVFSSDRTAEEYAREIWRLESHYWVE